MSKIQKLVVCAFIACVPGFAQSADLDHGRIEIRAFGGNTTGHAVLNSPAFSAGMEGAYGLNRFIALTGSYVYNNLGGETSNSCFQNSCYQSTASRRADEFMGGFRFSVPNSSKITPYATIAIGAIRLGTSASVSGPGVDISQSDSQTKFGASLGAGFDYKITRRFGISIDARAVEPVPLDAWYIRTSGGVYFRF